MNDRERDPWKFVILAGFDLVSVEMLFRFDQAASGILLAFPRPWGHVLLAGIALFCSVSLYGIIRQHTVRGVLWEQVGHIGLTGLFLVYGTWGFSVFNEKATGFASILVMCSIAALWRLAQIERRRRRAVGRGPS